jgi:DNA-binding GntR family transcriptional regulator
MDIRIEQKSLSNQAYNKIKMLILDESLKPGEKIIQEKVAEQLGISKIPLIQALHVLQNERLIEYYPRKGFFVREISTKEFFDLLEVRGSMETLAVERIIEKLDKAIVQKLINFKNDFISAFEKKDVKKYLELNKQFHYYMIETAGNSYLIDINNTFNILLLSYTKEFRTDISLSIEYYKNIIDSIIERDVEKASNMVVEHLEKVKEGFRK